MSRVIFESRGPGYAIKLIAIDETHLEVSAAGVLGAEEVAALKDRLLDWTSKQAIARVLRGDACPPGFFCTHEPKCKGSV